MGGPSWAVWRAMKRNPPGQCLMQLTYSYFPSLGRITLCSSPLRALCPYISSQFQSQAQFAFSIHQPSFNHQSRCSSPFHFAFSLFLALSSSSRVSRKPPPPALSLTRTAASLLQVTTQQTIVFVTRLLLLLLSIVITIHVSYAPCVGVLLSSLCCL